MNQDEKEKPVCGEEPSGGEDSKQLRDFKEFAQKALYDFKPIDPKGRNHSGIPHQVPSQIPDACQPALLSETFLAPLGTVKAQLHRARELLYDLLRKNREDI
jgi:hypothetical protein